MGEKIGEFSKEEYDQIKAERRTLSHGRKPVALLTGITLGIELIPNKDDGADIVTVEDHRLSSIDLLVGTGEGEPNLSLSMSRAEVRAMLKGKHKE